MTYVSFLVLDSV